MFCTSPVFSPDFIHPSCPQKSGPGHKYNHWKSLEWVMEAHWQVLDPVRVVAAMTQVSHGKKKTGLTFHESSWLVTRDPYIGFLESLYNWVV